MKRLVALHGFTGRSDDFEPLRRRLASARDLITPDWPGHGKKSGLREASAYGLEAHLGVIDEAAGDGVIELLGYSMGGRIALHWALRHPERVSKLVLVGSSPGLKSEAERAERRTADAALADFIRSQGVAAFMRYWHAQTMFGTLRRLPKDTLQSLRASRDENDAEGLALSLSHVGTGALPSLWERLPELRMPVELVTGSLDAKFTALAREMVTRIPRARHSELEVAGHAVHLERPDDLADVVLAR